ncbi:glycerol-3-phosphate dehydrogenase [Inquilinus ginsengisoli]|uniref:Glycerol-3-phosphate dehydrogenase n=1 Tax=Inquilinus ginsengisoli TaxID=363840 RepID=A0ABU1JKC9_9PROT|nr:NAD(P)/FAD-dependent oxidoreductase [Inquilinus ginsengisoli]MDR6289076.1 glycerol-3-phosphate dehydrogenase [Inquilinus ginsengisoli]
MDRYDVAVIGAGVVGCAVARRFALRGARVLVLEKGADILSGASKANSAILHTGFDAPEGSLELECIQRGHAEYLALRAEMNLPLLETGAIVVAWSEEEEARLGALERQARANGVDDVRILPAAEIRRLEPQLSTRARAGLHVPREHVIDPWSPFLAYATQVVAQGGRMVFDAEVTAGAFDGEGWTLDTAQGRFQAAAVVNCAGLFGDVVDQRLLGRASFEIRPRKGQFAVFDKAASALLTAIILPVPTERSKGVVLCRTIFGNVLVGPTAEEQADRTRATVTEPELRALVARAAEIVPALAGMPVTAAYAGLRPATEEKHYRIHQDTARRWITVGGIRSTGMTAALGIAQHVEALFASGPAATAAPAAPRMPNLADHLPRDWQRPGYDEIVCHCEMVTKREIEAALAGPMPPGDFGGLKRRTRCAMGRCQGFNCLGRLTEITAGRLPHPLPGHPL